MPYREVIGNRSAAVSLVSVAVGALPLGMTGLGLILWIHATSKSIEMAGAGAAAFTLGNAAGLTIMGCLLDRLNISIVVIPSAVVCAGALLSISAMADPGDVDIVVHFLAPVAGLTLPPVTTITRLTLGTIFTREAVRSAAYALLAVNFQAAIVIGPVLAAGIAHWLSPRWILVAASVAVTLGAGLSLVSGKHFGPYRERVRKNSSAPEKSTAGFAALLIIGAISGLIIGAVSFTVPLIALRNGQPGAAGLMLACVAIGDAMGALAYGLLELNISFSSQLLITQVLLAVGAAAAGLAGTQIYLVMPLLFVVGAAVAPSAVISSILIDRVIPSRFVARGYALLVTVGLVGSSAGSAISALLSRYTEQSFGFWLASLACTISFAATYLLRANLRRGGSGATPSSED